MRKEEYYCIDCNELLRELTKRRAAKAHDRNLGSGFYKMGYMDGFDDAIMIVMGIFREGDKDA